MSLTKSLWLWCLERNIHIIAQHLPGVLNQIADAESRTMIDRSDWKLNSETFSKIAQQFGLIEIDLFASRLTNQCKLYFSWRADLYANSNGRLPSRLIEVEDVRKSSLEPNRQSPVTGPVPGSQASASGTSMGNTTLVPNPLGNANRPAMPNAPQWIYKE